MPYETESFFDMVNLSFNNGPDFVGIIPIFSPANGSEIYTKFFRLDIYHTSATGGSTGIFITALSVNSLRCFFVNLFHFGIDKFKSGDATS